MPATKRRKKEAAPPMNDLACDRRRHASFCDPKTLNVSINFHTNPTTKTGPPCLSPTSCCFLYTCKYIWQRIVALILHVYTQGRPEKLHSKASLRFSALLCASLRFSALLSVRFSYLLFCTVRQGYSSYTLLVHTALFTPRMISFESSITPQHVPPPALAFA